MQRLILLDEDYDLCSPPVDGKFCSCERIEDLLADVSSHHMQLYPLYEKAADNVVDNLCAIRCENFALSHFGVTVPEDELIRQSKQNGWLSEDGTPLHNIGRLCALYDLEVLFQFKCTLDTISFALDDGFVVLAPIDGSELFEDHTFRKQKDTEQGQHLNHVVIVDSLSESEVRIYDSATPHQIDTYTIETFEDAWADSGKCLICIKK